LHFDSIIKKVYTNCKFEQFAQSVLSDWKVRTELDKTVLDERSKRQRKLDVYQTIEVTEATKTKLNIIRIFVY